MVAVIYSMQAYINRHINIYVLSVAVQSMGYISATNTVYINSRINIYIYMFYCWQYNL